MRVAEVTVFCVFNFPWTQGLLTLREDVESLRPTMIAASGGILPLLHSAVSTLASKEEYQSPCVSGSERRDLLHCGLFLRLAAH